MNELTLTGVDHPAVAADDVETLADWYCTVLGYTKWFRHWKADAGRPVWMLQAPDNTLLEIMPKDDTTRSPRTTWTPGWSHLALRVADIDRAIAYLDQQGVRWDGERVEAIGGGQVRSFFDPEGNMLQILQRPPADS
ncbi:MULTISPECIES: VOC family protein [Spirosoma]|uniref:VOC family protein n=1 Tax=Spirosoma sordidisoli TaxID=2502893 RepID=A0A4Q2UL95_9BACT|nr:MULTISPECIES: VOC family protein [Spirosoma]RYC69996.1 VOC family protein [Spirosoma sordidisoli]